MNFAKRSSFVVEASLLAHCLHHGFFASLGMANEKNDFRLRYFWFILENNRACSSGG